MCISRRLDAPLLLSVFMLGLSACTPQQSTTAPSAQQPQLEQAGQPINAGEVATRVVLARGAAVLGDQKAVESHINAIAEDMRRSMKLPDGSRPINREQARSVVLGIEGVRGVAWVDHANLMVRVKDASLRSQDMIDRVCIALQPLGDTLAVVVNLQNAAPRNHGELQTLSRNCQLQGDDRALLQTRRQMDVVPEAYRQQHAADQQRAIAEKQPVRQVDRKASGTILDNTPEM